MTVAGTAPTAICHLLREDADLADAVPAHRRHNALEECIAPVKRLPVGVWAGREPVGRSNGIGLLVLTGLLIRQVEVDGRYAAELLGDGDLLRPWEGDELYWSLPRATRWRVLKPTRVALLDVRVARRVSHYPELTGRLVGRALGRTYNLAVNMAIIHQARVDVRLHMLFWHLADRWGHVGPAGLMLPLELTHAALADLVAARRPTVTSALSELARTQRIRSIEGGWLVGGEPPLELLGAGATNGKAGLISA